MSANFVHINRQVHIYWKHIQVKAHTGERPFSHLHNFNSLSKFDLSKHISVII